MRVLSDLLPLLYLAALAVGSVLLADGSWKSVTSYRSEYVLDRTFEAGPALASRVVVVVFDGLSVHENIWVAARRHHGRREANRIVDEILERLRLSDLARRVVGQLAHGERQRVELGTVLTGEPELILLDEPTAGMTHEEVNQTTDLILEINKTTSMIVVEHDMQFIKSIAKRVTVFHQGAILIEDTMANLEQNQQVRDIYLGKQHAA